MDLYAHSYHYYKLAATFEEGDHVRLLSDPRFTGVIHTKMMLDNYWVHLDESCPFWPGEIINWKGENMERTHEQMSLFPEDESVG